MPSESVYHLVPAQYYHAQPKDKPYLPETYQQEGFIHCTTGLELLVEIANLYFKPLADELLVLEIDPDRLTTPLKFEAPAPPPGQDVGENHPSKRDSNLLFPHIYGPLNQAAIVNVFALSRNHIGRWELPG